MAEPASKFAVLTREGLILALFNKIGVQEGLVALDQFGNPGDIKDIRNKALDLLGEIVEAVDGKRVRKWEN